MQVPENACVNFVNAVLVPMCYTHIVHTLITCHVGPLIVILANLG